jgi:hypothetical protein
MCTRAAIRVALAFLTLIASVGMSARAACDTAYPVLTNLSLSPLTVDTTLSSQQVTCSMTLTDDLSGVASTTCQISPSPIANVKFDSPSCTLTAPSSGTPRNGVWSCGMTLPRYSHSGVWTVTKATAVDGAGNAFSFIGQSVFPTVSVISDPDTTPPVQTAISLSAATVDVSSASQSVTCTMTMTDDKAGVNDALCAIFSPSHAQKSFCEAFAPSSGTTENGVFSCNAMIPRYAEAGIWIAGAAAEDFALNGPINGGPPTASLTVTSDQSDMTAPTLTSFDFNPKSISDGAEQRQIGCTMVVADPLAGVALAQCTFISPDGTKNASCSATAPISGTRNNGTFQCNVIIPQYEVAGTWTSAVYLADETNSYTEPITLGNTVYIPQTLLLNVDCSAGDPETTCRFTTDRQTLSWDPVAGATRYDVYRGGLLNFVDANADHVPDGGYGTCQNARDANLTDTTFVDTDVPTPAQKGFFYVVDYRSGGVPIGLGTNSFGTARTVAAPCP